MWQQVYDPLNSTMLSALVAVIPIVFFLLGLTILKLSGIKAAIISLALALGIGIFVFGLPPGAGGWPMAYRLDRAHGGVAIPHYSAFRSLRHCSLLYLGHLH